MKVHLFTVFFGICGVAVAQQLSNMDFENWSYDPLSKAFTKIQGPWDAANSCELKYPGPDTICNSFITRQTDAKVGQYSLKLQTPKHLPPGTGGFSTFDASTQAQYVPFTFAPISFKGHYKFIKGAKDDMATISVDFFDGDLNTVKFGAEIFEEAKEWKDFSVKLFDIPPSSSIKYVQLTFFHASNNLSEPSLNTYLMLDGLSFIYSTNAVLDEAIKSGFRFYDGIIDITEMTGVSNMVIYNLNGGNCGTIEGRYDTQNLQNGIYVIGFEQNGSYRTFKWAIANDI